MALAEQKALFLLTKNGEFAVQDTPVPVPGPGEVLARVEAAALNPLEWKIQAPGVYQEFVQYPAILGSDAAGVVEQVGEGVTNVQKDDKIVWQGMLKNARGTFQRYALVPGARAVRIPPNVSLDEAASIPLALGTAFVALFNKKLAGGAELTPFWQVPAPYDGQPFVVLGGSTSVGQFVIQLAKVSGFSPIIATASERHTDYLKSLGATHVLSRSLPADSLRAEVLKITPDSIKIAYDAVSTADTQKVGWSLVAPGGQFVVVLAPPDGVVHGQDGKELVWVKGNLSFKELEEDEAGRELYAHLGQWLRDGSIKPNRVQVIPGGLPAIPAGLELLRQDKVSGVKLVVHPQEVA
ncbi:GroES-like protein [Punctularia strigosozonata HHB-11173 SS5]|uniref:GroES-like protein n=1 Tax=Punctularia strigosozonata (strain HHB-11173) TaxID=741275 RepID=UPI0004416FC3|nr:GroES-like protein [Punctularia strigosozonata HHB-11173 SS5]EIN12453.1 GroES-like protein [Punctularia strigosozonata HHB-11173 SS5]